MRTTQRATRRRTTSLIALVGTIAVLVTLVGFPSTYAGTATGGFAAQTAASAPKWGLSRVSNGSFEARGSGWRSNGRLRFARGGRTGQLRAAVSTPGARAASLWDAGNTAQPADALTRWRASAWVRSTGRPVGGRLQVVQRTGRTVVTHARKFRLVDNTWHQVELLLTVTEDRAALDLALNTGKLNRSVLLVDDIQLQPLQADEPEPQPDPEPEPDPEPQPQPQGNTLTNGCAINVRGVPDTCGAYFGGITGSNSDPSSIEQSANQQFGVRRTYWRADQVTSAVKVAAADVAKNRLPWISFKLPHTWPEMAAGKGDAWAKDLVDKLDALDGPVWIAFHHEPENDPQSMSDWKKMQEHLGPLVRSRSDSVAFTAILMGWPNLYGKTEHRLENVWPETKVDVAGFDVYNFEGTPQGDGIRTKPVDFEGAYYSKFDAWAKAHNTTWGQAETGYTDYSANKDPNWIQDNYKLLKKHNGVAYSYFNTGLNSVANWKLDSASKMADFKAALKTSPTLR